MAGLNRQGITEKLCFADVKQGFFLYGCKEITTCHFDAILTASVLAGLSCGVVSGLLNGIAKNLFEKDWNFNKLIFAFDEYMNFPTAAIIGRIPVTILDRVVTTFLGFGISKLYSRIIYGER